MFRSEIAVAMFEGWNIRLHANRIKDNKEILEYMCDKNTWWHDSFLFRGEWSLKPPKGKFYPVAEGKNLLEWPSEAADFNPIKNLLKELKIRVHRTDSLSY